MGFKKRGVRMMAIFWGLVALACVSGLEWFALALPVVWAYSFFQVHNLKSLPEDVFYLQKDEYAFHFGYVLEHKREMLKKYRVVIAAMNDRKAAIQVICKAMDHYNETFLGSSDHTPERHSSR